MPPELCEATVNARLALKACVMEPPPQHFMTSLPDFIFPSPCSSLTASKPPAMYPPQGLCTCSSLWYLCHIPTPFCCLCSDVSFSKSPALICPNTTSATKLTPTQHPTLVYFFPQYMPTNTQHIFFLCLYCLTTGMTL